ncbi:HD domain-containing protein [Enterococcus wangshanyuanii]|uniref:Metal-dependent phosphohydrolase n=1 Tax=Enterococcus wangshanyuanii TaxID=2005703 RepID=A0ABQ1NQN7_9ENTE|nr:HD domain-containing protein [Enterococcus wangshanyuanii]GGC82779.1 metal-dependent phosphohydrolase [Enterococcus wangshanyuanii]
MDKQTIGAIEAFVQAKLQEDKSGHGMDHIERVVRNAQKIAQTEVCDEFVVAAAAYLHDVADEKLVEDQGRAYQEIVDVLQKNNVSAKKIEHILYIIKNLSFSQELEGTTKELSIEGQIVQDADRLDAMGAIGIIRTIYYGGHKGNKIYDPTIKPRLLQNKSEYREESTIINHFYEKILLLNDRLNTPYAKTIGKQRQEFLENFLTEFLEEWE